MTGVGLRLAQPISLITFGLCLSLAPPGVKADCARWDIDGEWHFVQDNGAAGRFTIRQTGTGIEGDATTSNVRKGGLLTGDDVLIINGQLKGAIDGNSFKFMAYWSDGNIGVYTGTIGPLGLTGSTYDNRHSQAKTSWNSARNPKCLTLAGGTPYAAFCQEYASKAVAAAKENVELQCGNSGLRWSQDSSMHLDWCLGLGAEEEVPNSETAARASALQSCQEQIARRGEIVTKPNIPIGDLTKQVTPPSAVPPPPVATRNLLRQMKP